MNRVDEMVSDLLHVLELAGVLLAVLVVLGLLVGLLRSLVQVSLGRSTLVLPFSGGESAAWVADVLAEQLDQVENRVVEKHKEVRDAEALAQGSTTRVQLGPAVRFLPEQPLDEDIERLVVEQPISGQAIGPITLLGVSFSPESVFAAFYRLRALAARKTVRGTLYRLGPAGRISSRFTFTPHSTQADRRSKKPVTRTLVVKRETIETDGQLLDLVDDLAFGIARERMDLNAGTGVWAAYSSFLEGYLDNLYFLRTGDIPRRDQALRRYEDALSADEGYHLAAYNAACLLYNKYSESENARAIDMFRTATQSKDPELRALALAGLTMAYGQNVHRYGLGSVPWVERADLASRQAVGLKPDSEETRFARAWAHQVAEDFDEAIGDYLAIGELTGNSLSARQIKSFAANNAAWLLMTQKGDLAGARALLQSVVDLYPNKMVYANLAELARREGDFEAALDLYAEARSLDPLYANAYNETALVFLAKAQAEVDPQTKDDFMRKADEWHARALGVVPETDKNQRRTMEDVYRAAREAASAPALQRKRRTADSRAPKPTRAS
jgi:tetratricopeptide (TPR) repeat protein